jgi:DnaA N-terminal domain
VLNRGDVVKFGKGHYEVRLEAGERLLAAGYQRGSGAGDGMADRMLLWHLRSLGFSPNQGRDLVRTRPDQVRTVLRRVYYLQAVKGGQSNGKPVQDWNAWARAAIEGEYAFSDADWQKWLDVQLAAGQRGAWAPTPAPTAPSFPRVTTAAAGEPSRNGAEVPTSSAEVEAIAVPRALQFADDLWGHALERFVGTDPAKARAYETWLARTALERVTDTDVTVVAEDGFAAEWITQKYRDPLSAFLSTVAGRPLTLHVRAELLRTADATGSGEQEGAER